MSGINKDAAIRILKGVIATCEEGIARLDGLGDSRCSNCGTPHNPFHDATYIMYGHTCRECKHVEILEDETTISNRPWRQ